MIGKFAGALLGGLSAPQAFAAKAMGLGFAAFIAWVALKGYGVSKYNEGFDSRNEYVLDIETKYTTAESERLRLDAELTDCQRVKSEYFTKIDALTTQNADAAKQAANVLMETQRINAQAIAAAAQRSNDNSGFYAALDERLKGLKNECDANGNGIVVGGADILRSVQQKR